MCLNEPIQAGHLLARQLVALGGMATLLAPKTVRLGEGLPPRGALAENAQNTKKVPGQ